MGIFPIFALEKKQRSLQILNTVLKLFRNQNPYAVLILFITAALLKLPFFTAELSSSTLGHQVLWQLMLKKSSSILGSGSYFYYLISVINITLQGLLLNYVCNEFHLFSERTYLPAYTYILITSLLPEWTNLSVEMMNNWLIIIMLNLVFHTYSDINVRKVLFNVGFVLGLLTIFNLPNFWFLFYAVIAIAILRAYQPAEWMVTLLGVATPVYLFIGLAYLTDSMYMVSQAFSPDLDLYFILEQKVVMALSLLALMLLISIILLSRQMDRMLFQIKKMWWVSLLLLVFAMCSTLGLYKMGTQIWHVIMVPMALMLTQLWYIKKPRWMPELFNLILIAGIVAFNLILP